MEAAKTAITHDPILVDLALQGGGSHGAFTCGVLDRSRPKEHGSCAARGDDPDELIDLYINAINDSIIDRPPI